MTQILPFLTAAVILFASAAHGGELRQIFAVNYPLAYFAERLVGENVEITSPAVDDPAIWFPTMEDISKIQSSDLIILNGAGYAEWINAVSLPQRRSLNTTRNKGADFIALPADFSHTHGPGGDTEHGTSASITWLNFKLARAQAQAINERLGGNSQGWSQLATDLDDLDARMKEIGALANGRQLLASHPVYHYLAAAYGLNIKSVHWEPGQPPDNAGWQALDEIIEDHPAKVMLWEGQPDAATAARLQKMGIRVAVFQPLGRRPATGDFLSTMVQNVTNLRGALSK